MKGNLVIIVLRENGNLRLNLVARAHIASGGQYMAVKDHFMVWDGPDDEKATKHDTLVLAMEAYDELIARDVRAMPPCNGPTFGPPGERDAR